MSKKKVSIAPKPTKSADKWVEGGKTTAKPTRKGKDVVEAMKRFTIDVPVSLHTRIKMECARRGVKMADQIREMLEKRFAE
jgi:predicted DNA binding CopG/RHH family protein